MEQPLPACRSSPVYRVTTKPQTAAAVLLLLIFGIIIVYLAGIDKTSMPQVVVDLMSKQCDLSKQCDIPVYCFYLMQPLHAIFYRKCTTKSQIKCVQFWMLIC